MDDLKREHGEGKLPTKFAGARHVVQEINKKHGGKLTQLLDETRLGDNPRFVKFFIKKAEQHGWC